MPHEIHIDESWKHKLSEDFNKTYFKDLSKFVHSEYEHHTVYPNPKEIFRAFDLCPFDKVKVVILGQDPYHGADQANGLSFAVHQHVALPPSLKNIFKEIQNDTSTTPLQNGDLARWAEQGVLLLNATLTVRANSPGSHQKHGWEEFTTSVIQKLSQQRTNIVFLLWGNYAKQKCSMIDRSKHLVLEAPHPSPLSAYTGFFGCKHFSTANAYLYEHGKSEINWR